MGYLFTFLILIILFLILRNFNSKKEGNAILTEEKNMEHVEEEPSTIDSDTPRENEFESYSLDKPREKIIISKNAFLHPDDGFGIMEPGTEDGKLKKGV
jgi:hypothetical protein